MADVEAQRKKDLQASLKRVKLDKYPYLSEKQKGDMLGAFDFIRNKLKEMGHSTENPVRNTRPIIEEAMQRHNIDRGKAMYLLGKAWKTHQSRKK